MLKTPSLKSHSNPSERSQSEQYIQCFIHKIVRQEQQLNSSYYEEDQIDQCQNNNNVKKFEEYLQLVEKVTSNPPQSHFLSKYYVISTENETITLISETSPETLMDYLKLRQQNNAPMSEDEIIYLAYSILNALTKINLLYLSPINIIKKWKIINYIENMLQQDQRNYLEQEDKLYLAPELKKYLEIELNDCDDFNQHISEEILAPKATIYSLGVILLQCVYTDLKLESNIQDLLKNHKYSWSIRDLIEQMLCSENERSSAEELLQNPIFYKVKNLDLQPKQTPQMSLTVFLQLVKNKFSNLDWADQFFTLEEIISISDLKEGIYPIGELKSEINTQITQIISNCPQNCGLEDLIGTLTKLASPQSQTNLDQSTSQPKKQQFLFKKWFKKQELKSEDMQELVLAPQEPTSMAQVLLLKLLSSASEKAFQAFIQKAVHFIGGTGMVWQNIRKICWPRALGFESLEAHREIVQLTLELCDYLNEQKEKDMQQLEKDLARQKYNKKSQESIRITIRGFINQSNMNCYIQGMDSISYTLLEAFNNDTELATICLNELYKRRIVKLPSEDKIIDLSLYYGEKLQEKILLYQWTLQYFDPGLVAYLKEQDFKCETHIVSWFSTFYSREFSIESVLKIYDYLLISDESFEIVFACLIMLDLKSTFEIKDSEGMLGCLKNLQNNIQLDECLKEALRISTELHKTFFILTHQDEETCNQMKEENEYLKERPWEHPVTFKQLQEQPIFSISVHDFQQLLRESKSHLNVLSIDMRNAKDYEQACVSGSLFANYDKKKIGNQQILTYLELRGMIEITNIYYIIIIYDSEKQNSNEIIEYLLKQRVKRLCLLKGGIQAVLQDAQEIIKLKQKAVLPPWVKQQIEELKKKQPI